MRGFLLSALMLAGLYGAATAAMVAVSAGPAAADCWAPGCGWRWGRWHEGGYRPWYDDGRFGLGEVVVGALALGTVAAIAANSNAAEAEADCRRVRVDETLYLNCGARWFQRVGPQTWAAVDDPT